MFLEKKMRCYRIVPSFAESERFPVVGRPPAESLSELSLTPESAELPLSPPTVAYVAVRFETRE